MIVAKSERDFSFDDEKVLPKLCSPRARARDLWEIVC